MKALNLDIFNEKGELALLNKHYQGLLMLTYKYCANEWLRLGKILIKTNSRFALYLPRRLADQ